MHSQFNRGLKKNQVVLNFLFLVLHLVLQKILWSCRNCKVRVLVRDYFPFSQQSFFSYKKFSPIKVDSVLYITFKYITPGVFHINIKHHERGCIRCLALHLRWLVCFWVLSEADCKGSGCSEKVTSGITHYCNNEKQQNPYCHSFINEALNKLFFCSTVMFQWCS